MSRHDIDQIIDEQVARDGLEGRRRVPDSEASRATLAQRRAVSQGLCRQLCGRKVKLGCKECEVCLAKSSAAAKEKYAQDPQMLEYSKTRYRQKFGVTTDRQKTCGHCGKKGHNKRTCPELEVDK